MIEQNTNKYKINFLKVPQHLHNRANQKGLLNDLLFWYSLKPINVQGFIPDENKIQIIEQATGRKKSHIYHRLKRLALLGWIKVFKNGIRLVKYDDLWSYFGYDVKKEKFARIFKIDLNVPLQEQIWYNEIRHNLNNQCHSLCSFYRRTKCRNKDTENIRQQRALKKMFCRNYYKNLLLQYKKQKNWKLGKKSFINFEVTLTCQSIADLLGYTSKMKGWQIQNKLQQSGYISVDRSRLLHLNKQMDVVDFYYADLDSSYLHYKDRVHKVLPNLMYLNNDNLPYGINSIEVCIP